LGDRRGDRYGPEIKTSGRGNAEKEGVA